MKKINIAFAFLVLALAGCRNNEYDSWLTTMSMTEVSNITLNPNGQVLVADGKCALTFVVKATMDVKDTRTVELIVSGENVVQEMDFETNTLVKSDRLAGESFEIKSSRGEVVENFTFSTTEGAGSEISFTCTLNDKVSAPVTVKLVAPPTPYTTDIVVPVIFHVLYGSNEVSASQTVTQKAVQAYIDHANLVFSGEAYPNAPAVMDSRIRFKAATHDPDGKPLDEPGIRREQMSTTSASGALSPIITAIRKGDRAMYRQYVWPQDKYLNIYVYQSYSHYAIPPVAIMNGYTFPGTGEPFPGFNTTDVANTLLTTMKFADSIDDYFATNPDDAATSLWVGGLYAFGPMIYLRDFNEINKPGWTGSYTFETLLGVHYGLMRTACNTAALRNRYAAYGDIDWCPDTYTYISWDMGVEKKTYVPADLTESVEPIYFNSYNAIDSQTTSVALTPDQIKRIRYCIEACADRRAGWPGN